MGSGCHQFGEAGSHLLHVRSHDVPSCWHIMTVYYEMASDRQIAMVTNVCKRAVTSLGG